ncbi:ATP-binding protein [Paenibacillus xerothermodurans]|uniref:histidine kinase n=1 Tax=Paenibacillus xerothermodurans TaxID=1977292 RepID=A0A2W1NAW6_PAEXE|nr:sensor histidine kinase [Paenibacillus xerothermodurans]PZE21064.1 sensor histidine kinase [Paenibacillus xerothermodurans]
MPLFKQKPPLQLRITGLVLTVVLSILVIVGYLFNLIIVQSVEDAVGKSAMDVATLLSELPDIRQAMEQRNPNSYLQTRTQEIKAKTQAGFITILDANGIRYSHNNPELIGRRFTGGDEGPALRGERYISKAVGISGPSIRAFVPVEKDGRIIGVISVGMFNNNVYSIVNSYFSSVLYYLSVGLGLGILLSILLARSIKKTMYGLEPDEIASIVKEREALLDCLHEGVLAVDKSRTVTLINESARTTLSLGSDALGKHVTEIIPSSRLSAVVETKEKEYNSEHSVNGVTIIVNRAPILVNDEVVGAVSTFRDITELRSLAEELTGVKQYVEGLRAKTHEFMNRLHTLHGLLELQEYDEAKALILQTNRGQQKLLQFLGRKILDPKTSALLLGKMQQAEEKSIAFTVHAGSHLSNLPDDVSNSMILVLGNLIDNAFDAVDGRANATVEVTLLEQPDQWVILVEDNGRGIPEEQLDLIFHKHYSTKNSDRGYGLYLVKNHVDHALRGQIDITSTPDEGTAFWINIPRRGDPQQRIGG